MFHVLNFPLFRREKARQRGIRGNRYSNAPTGPPARLKTVTGAIEVIYGPPDSPKPGGPFFVLKQFLNHTDGEETRLFKIDQSHYLACATFRVCESRQSCRLSFISSTQVPVFPEHQFLRAEAEPQLPAP
jgi:hypothetical protein